MYLIKYLEYKNFVNSERSLPNCIRSEIHSKVVFDVTLESTFSQPGYILSANNDIVDRKVKVMKMLLLIERSRC